MKVKDIMEIERKCLRLEQFCKDASDLTINRNDVLILIAALLEELDELKKCFYEMEV